jgi:hypothetical protein
MQRESRFGGVAGTDLVNVTEEVGSVRIWIIVWVRFCGNDMFLGVTKNDDRGRFGLFQALLKCHEDLTRCAILVRL